LRPDYIRADNDCDYIFPLKPEPKTDYSWL